MVQVSFLWLIGATVGVVVLLWIQRRRSAQLEVNRLIERAGLPAEPRLVEAALTWQQRRQETLLIGILIGTVAAGAVVLLVRNGLHVGLASSDVADDGLLTWLLAAAAVAGAGGLATLAYNYRVVRESRSEGRRTATLRPRQLADYLSPWEIVIQYSCLVLPLVAIGLGVVILGTADRPASGWILIVSGLVAVPLWALGLFLQRRALLVNRPSGDKAVLLWQEALRASTLRDVGSSVLMICWMLGAALPMSFQWPSGTPHFVQPVATVAFLVSVVMLCGRGVLAASRRGLGRVQRIAG